MSLTIILEATKYIITIPVFLFWSFYDLLTKTVRVKWQRTLIGFGIIYNFFYLFIDKNIANDNVTGLIICYLISKLYSLAKKLLKRGKLGGGDVTYFAIIGFLFGTAIGVLTIVLSFIIFDVLLNLSMKISKNLKSISVAFFPFITCALIIIVLFIGETRVRGMYNYFFNSLGISEPFIKIF